MNVYASENISVARKIREQLLRPCIAGLFVWLIAVSGAWGDTPSVPVVRYAYTVVNSKPSKDVRLEDHVEVVVCKSEYDRWTQGPNIPPNILLYMGGRVLQGPVAAAPVLIDATFDDGNLGTKRPLCGDADANIAQLEKTAQASEAASKAAADKVSATGLQDPQLADFKKDADAKAISAKADRDKVNTARQAEPLYALDFFLDPAFVAKADSKNSWLQILSHPWNDSDISVSAGQGSGPWPTQATVTLQRINLWSLAAWAVLFVFAIVLFVRYARTSDIIRDTGVLPAGVAGQKSYSLARTQMALWTFLVAGSLAFIFMVTRNENVISNGVLALIGISFGTTLLASVADGTAPVPQATQGFFTDLLTDGTGPSFHRYQMVLFTIILAVIFIVQVGANLVMPEFDTTLLGLMGISNGTYLGFKLQGR
jgi:hypothetical protein